MRVASKYMAKTKRYIEDLDQYEGCNDKERFGMNPLAVAFLQRGQRFETGTTTGKTLALVLKFCDPRWTVCAIPQPRNCPLCNSRAAAVLGGREVVLGSAEIRVIGEEDIFAAPDLLYHYIEAHNYMPPPEFLVALKTAKAGSIEHRALINALR
jgi:hypothetical protein